MKRVHALIAASAMLAACVSTGVNVRQEQLENFLLDFSTLDDVTTQLGQPTSQTTLSNGSTILVYSFASSRPNPESFIPFIGPLFAGGSIRSSTVLLEFDENGVLRSQRRTMSTSASGLSVLPEDALP
ncbi:MULTISPECIES: hypothetical protein [Cupriavidus]|uniref:Lipoprotein n=1 Tax=Cupriavidus oxalaticus TaxID=96344 RepID=A0A4P7LFB8_9BURK|nr:MULTISPECIES: hypothetical protein [Cupriavidus]MBF6991246.1 hypothetical protein [Cupriavidus sp. IK-TO18]QBY52979.1 hypothetical protein E0W60_17715 [Cupriavidus oxalaticus]TDF59506.1 hypothetical protein E1J61_34725 [Cupriavidus sp. L7L]